MADEFLDEEADLQDMEDLQDMHVNVILEEVVGPGLPGPPVGLFFQGAGAADAQVQVGGQANPNQPIIKHKLMCYPKKKREDLKTVMDNRTTLARLCENTILKILVKFCVSEMIRWEDRKWLQFKEHFQTLPRHLRDELFKAIFHNPYSSKVQHMRSLTDMYDLSVFPSPSVMAQSRRRYPQEVLAAIRQLSGKDLFTAWWFFLEEGKTNKLGFKPGHDLKFSDALMTYINAGNRVDFVELDFTYNWFLSGEFISMIKKLKSLKKLTVHSTQNSRKVLNDLAKTGKKLESFNLSFPEISGGPFIERSYLTKRNDSLTFALDFLKLQADTLTKIDVRGWLSTKTNDDVNELLKVLNNMTSLKHLTLSIKDMKTSDLSLYPNIVNLDHLVLAQYAVRDWGGHHLANYTWMKNLPEIKKVTLESAWIRFGAGIGGANNFENFDKNTLARVTDADIICDTANLLQFLDYLPSARNVKLTKSPMPQQGGGQDQIENLQPRPHLKKLVINCNTMQTADTLAILKSANNLEEIELKQTMAFQHYNKDEFLEEIDGFEPESFPNLKKFTSIERRQMSHKMAWEVFKFVVRNSPNLELFNIGNVVIKDNHNESDLVELENLLKERGLCS